MICLNQQKVNNIANNRGLELINKYIINFVLQAIYKFQTKMRFKLM